MERVLDPVCSYINGVPVCKRGGFGIWYLTTPFANRGDNIQTNCKPDLAINHIYKLGGLHVAESTRFLNRVKIRTIEATSYGMLS